MYVPGFEQSFISTVHVCFKSTASF